MEEAVNHSTDLTVPCQSEEGNHLTCSDYSSYTSNNNFSLEKEKENEGEECVDHLQIETESSTFEDASLDTYQHDHNTVLSVSVSGIVTDAKAEISGITDFSDLSLNDEKPQSEQREDETSLTLDNHDDVCLLIPTHETEGEPEKDVDQQEVQVINGEVSEPGFPPVLDKNGCDGENILMAEEISHLHEGMEVKEECKDHQQTEILSSTSEQEKPSQHEQSDHEHDALDMDHDVLCPPISPPETKIQHEMAENGTSVDQQMINDDAPEVNITTADDTNACPHENSLIAKEICNPLEGVHDDSLVSKTANEDTDSSHFNDEQQMDKKYSYNANDGIPSTAVCHVAEESESVVLSLALLCLHEPTDIIKESTESTRKVVAVQPMPQNVNVTFRVHYLSQSPHQTVAVTGNQQELGSWKGFIPLEKAKDGYWSCVVSLPAESHVEWKFVVLDKGKVCRWEECGNRLLDTGFGDDLLVHKWWGFL
uniref:Starch-binding domain-containing protein 1 n=1 Tax=Sphaeramia orbicularis TaxID=375764 RepID=A0A673B5Q3_9TELE